MDSDALFLVKQLFWQGAYKACIDEATSVDISDQTDPESLSRALYAARAHLALPSRDTTSALSVLEPALTADEPAASVRAVKSFAEYLQAEDKSSKVEELRDLVLEYDAEEVNDETREEERIVRSIAGTVFIVEKEVEEAVTTLSEGCGKTDLECTALLVQLLLSIHRRDVAQTIYQNAKSFGEDSLLMQIMEAWIGMKTGGRPLNQSYYLYEELYQLPSGRTPTVLASHAAAHLLLGHVDEAKSDILEAQQTENGKNDAAVLSVGATLGMPGCFEQLKSVDPSHPSVSEWEAKSREFDEAAAKFKPVSA